METKLSITPFSDPVIEERIIKLKNQVISYSTVQAKSDAAKDSEILRPYFRIQIYDYIHSLAQETLDAIKSRLLNMASIVNANAAETIATQENTIITNKVNDFNHQHAVLKSTRDSLPVNHFKRKYGKWLIAFAVLLGISDGIILFFNFASGGYALLLSLLAAVTITSIISFSHVVYKPWIEKSKTQEKKYIKLLTVFGLVFVIFWIFGNIRALAANNHLDVALESSEVSSQSQTNVSGWIIALVSFGTFILVHNLSNLFRRTPSELKAEEEYERLSKEMDGITEQIGILEKQKKENVKVPIALKQEARIKYNLWQTSVAQCKGISTSAIITYRQTYTRHNPVIPSFFNDQIDFDFQDTIDFSQPQKS